MTRRALVAGALVAIAGPAAADPTPNDHERFNCFWQNVAAVGEWLIPDLRVEAMEEADGNGVDFDLILSWPVGHKRYLDHGQRHVLVAPFVEPQLRWGDHAVRGLIGSRVTYFPRARFGEYGLSIEAAGMYETDSDGPGLVLGVGLTIDLGEQTDHRGGLSNLGLMYRRAVPLDGRARNDLALDMVISYYGACPDADPY